MARLATIAFRSFRCKRSTDENRNRRSAPLVALYMNALKALFKKQPRITMYSDEELRARLSPEEYRVTNLAGTERPYSGEYLETTTDGTYHCRVCDAELFASENKYESGTGWPGFNAPIDSAAIAEQPDYAMFIPRTETLCAHCGAHLGHVFPEGLGGAKTRYCINSASIRLEPADMHAEESVPSVRLDGAA